jgi:hypothetical protein
MTVILTISLALLALATFVAFVFSSSLLRFAVIIVNTAWSYFLLGFYMGGLTRKISDVPSNPYGLADPYRQGVSAYSVAIWDTKISLALLILSLVILAVVQRSAPPKVDASANTAGTTIL